jgi:hypothetical protein
MLLSMAAAGCAGGDAGTESLDEATAAPAAHDQDTGGIDGVVLDGEGLPIAGVQVAVLDAELQTVSDKEGAFSFSDMKPGSATVVAQRLGFETKAQKVDVVAGKVTEVSFMLEQITVAEPYTTLQEGAALVTCAIGFPVVTVYPNAVGNACGTVLGLEDKRSVTFPVDVGAQESYTEMVWEPTNNVFGSELRSVNSFDGDDEGAAAGPSPLVFGFDDYDDDLEGGEEFNHFLWANWGSANTTNPGHSIHVFHEQHVTVYFSIFFHQERPQGYSAIPE